MAIAPRPRLSEHKPPKKPKANPPPEAGRAIRVDHACDSPRQTPPFGAKGLCGALRPGTGTASAGAPSTVPAFGESSQRVHGSDFDDAQCKYDATDLTKQVPAPFGSHFSSAGRCKYSALRRIPQGQKCLVDESDLLQNSRHLLKGVCITGCMSVSGK